MELRVVFLAVGICCATRSVASQQDADTALVNHARRIAFSVSARHSGHAMVSEVDANSAAKGLSALRASRARALSVLGTVMRRPDSSYVARSAAAYGVWLLDSTQVDTVVKVLIQQMNRVAFANVHIADDLIVAIGPPAIPELLKHSDNSMVLALLGRMGAAASPAVPGLKGMLGDNNIDVAEVLVAIGTPEAIAAARPVLLAALNGSSTDERRLALTAVSSAGAALQDLRPLVRAQLQDKNSDVRLAAAHASMALGDTVQAVSVLTQLLQNPDFENRYDAIRALGSAGPAATPAIPVLLKIAEAPRAGRADEFLDAAVALTRINPANARVRQLVVNLYANPSYRRQLEAQAVRP